MPDNTIISHVCTEYRLLALTLWPKTKPNPIAIFFLGGGEMGMLTGFIELKLIIAQK